MFAIHHKVFNDASVAQDLAKPLIWIAHHVFEQLPEDHQVVFLPWVHSRLLTIGYADTVPLSTYRNNSSIEIRLCQTLEQYSGPKRAFSTSFGHL